MNRLANESSPYLLQHADNPVDWYPWGEEAFKKARDEDKPIFLSIGYSACHWCHVMEHECFENVEIAEIMNRYFVNIKVDREERPDIDEIYQTACQIITGTGGWPLSVFLTPELKPFYVGTYFPPNDRYGIPGFITILNRIKDMWISNRDHVKSQAENIFKKLLEIENVNINGVESIDRSILDEAAILLIDNADHVNGGFDSAPKFPNTTLLTFLLEYYKLTNYTKFKNFVLLTLDKMSQGGIYDQVGGGFHRYSTDSKWLIPHFEKMLYDNALIPVVYCEAYQLSNEYRYLRIAKETLDYVIREMLSNEGGFYSTQDADSEGVEGKYYTFTYDEIYNLFGEEKARIVSSYYGITKEGNFEGRNVLHIANSKESIARRFNKSIEEIEGIIEECRKVLLIEREKRVKPFRDEKIITSWNSLMISAFLKYYSITSDMSYFVVGKKALEFIYNKLSNTNYELKHVYKDGKSYIDAFFDDYAFYIKALLDLFKVSKEDRYLNYAIEYVKHVIEEFTLELYYTSDKHTGVIIRKKHIYDLSIPSPTSIMAYNFLLLYKYTSEKDYLEKATSIIKRYARLASENPFAFGSMLNAIYFYLTIKES